MKRSIYLKKKMTRSEAEDKLAELYEQAELIFNAAINPSQASSMSISSGGGSKSVTFKSASDREAQSTIIKVAIEDLEARLEGRRIPESIIKRVEVQFK